MAPAGRPTPPATSASPLPRAGVVLLADGRLGAEMTLPGWMNDVLREPGWPLMVVAEMYP